MKTTNILLVETNLIKGLQYKCPICGKITLIKENQVNGEPVTRLILCNSCIDKLTKSSFKRVLEYLFFLLILSLTIIFILFDSFKPEIIAITVFVGIIYLILSIAFSAYYLWHKRKYDKNYTLKNNKLK